MCKFEQEFITMFLKKLKRGLHRWGVMLCFLFGWMLKSLHTLRNLTSKWKKRDQSKKKSWFSEFKNTKLKGKRIRKHVFTCFVRCTLKNFLFICRWEIELVKCSQHIPLLNLSQSLITYWQSIGATKLDQTKTHDSFRQIKIYFTPSNTFPSHSRLLPLSERIDPSLLPLFPSTFYCERKYLDFSYIHQNTLIPMLRGIKRSRAWLRLVDLDF